MKRDELLEHVDFLARDVIKEDCIDSIHTFVESSEYVIWYSSAWDLVNHIRFTDLELYIEANEMIESCKEGSESLDQLMTLAAHWILYTMVGDRVEELTNDKAA